MAATIQPDLAQNERAITSDILETCQVGLEWRLCLEKDVEADEVDKGQLQILGRGIVDVGDQTVRVGRFHRSIQPREELLDPVMPIPAHHRGRDLIPDRVAQDGRMAGASAHLLAYT